MKQESAQFDDEFKRRAVEMSYSRNNIKELAKELGIRPELLYRWRSLYGQDGAVKPSVQQKIDLEEELRKTKRELDQIRMERDILKKAVSIFSKTDGVSFR